MPVHIVERLQKMNRASGTCGRSSREPIPRGDRRRGELAHPAGPRGEGGSAGGDEPRPAGRRAGGSVGDFVAGDGPLPDEEVEVSLRSQALQAALQTLSAREREVLALRYGLDDYEPKTLEEIDGGWA